MVKRKFEDGEGMNLLYRHYSTFKNEANVLRSR
jgi:hypothetical protein